MGSYKPLTVGITGGSASGKTTFARALAGALEDFTPVVLNQDHYFRDWNEFPPEERAEVRTSNHPRGVLWPAFVEHVERLVARQPIEAPAPGTRARHRGDAVRTVEPRDLVIVEGHLIFCNETLRDLMEIRIFIDADPHERVLRRMLRDTTQSGMTLEEAVAWYRRDVIPNFPVYTEASRQYAHLVVPFDGDGSPAVALIASGIRETLRNRRSEEGNDAGDRAFKAPPKRDPGT